MSQNAPVLIAMFLVVLALVSGAVVVANRLLRADTSEQTEPELGSEAWRTATAEVVSTLKAGNRTFLQVRFRAGRSLIRTDVPYPASQGVVPLVPQRVPIKYAPSDPGHLRPAPGRSNPAAGDRVRRPEPTGHPRPAHQSLSHAGTTTSPRTPVEGPGVRGLHPAGCRERIVHHAESPVRTGPDVR